MTLYKIRRYLPDCTETELEAAALRAAFCSYAFDDSLKWHRSYFDPVQSEIYCIYEAREPEQLQAHARLSQIPCDEIVEVRELLPDSYLAEAEAQGGAESSALRELRDAGPEAPAVT